MPHIESAAYRYELVMSGMAVKARRIVGLATIALLGAIAINSIPHPARPLHGWQYGWPWRSIDALPALMLVPAERATYWDHYGEMQRIWRTGIMGAGRNWAMFEYDQRWRWLRLPNGHVILFSTIALCANAIIWLGTVGATLCAFHVWRRSRNAGLNSVKCRECGYNLTGNVSGRCPECGTPVASDAQAEARS